ncbi:hypothetical protein ACFVHB_29795 [Kitasatospora sp. NPDC127111]|uniref:hypothetical protein n=1 Tax=Kitasatospora sp. NPDC127111 TaxID=3345363 RepID=UPI003634B2C9
MDNQVEAAGADARNAGDEGTRYRPGDVLRLECPFTEVVVTGVSRCHVALRWPWWEIDTAANGIEWNGQVALPTPAGHGWENAYFRTRPAEDTLKAGDRCLVGMPPTVVHVLAVDHFDPPLVTGWLPRPATYVHVLRQGETYDAGIEEQGYEIDPVGGEPIQLDLIFRPFAFLETGDEVVDHDGRAWRFDPPWRWHAFDGGQPSTPSWPLALLFRGGEPAPEAVAAVAEATATGSHVQEMSRWVELTLAEPITPA